VRRYGELESRWVAMETWTFTTTISAAEADALLAQVQVVLQLDGVDTYADVSLNGQKVFSTNSFHRRVCRRAVHVCVRVCFD
jgi:beta-mannosidase